MNKYRFKHRSIQDYNLKCFNKLLDAIIRSGFKIECCGLIDCKPMLPDDSDSLYKFIKEKHPYELIPNAKVKTYKRRAEEFNTKIILDSFCLTVNKEIGRIFKEDLLEVKPYVD